MESIKQRKVDLRNKKEETRDLRGKTPGGETSMKARPCILQIILPNTTTRACSSTEFIWDPYNSQALHTHTTIEPSSPLLFRLEGYENISQDECGLNSLYNLVS